MPSASGVILAGVAGGIAPDLDFLRYYLLDDTQVHRHRYWSHIPGCWALIALVVLPLVRAARPGSSCRRSRSSPRSSATSSSTRCPAGSSGLAGLGRVLHPDPRARAGALDPGLAPAPGVPCRIAIWVWAACSGGAPGAGMRAPTALSRPEFVAMIATLFATVAFSIDAMLPALPRDRRRARRPTRPNRAQLVLTTFVLGMGLGTLRRRAAVGRLRAQAVITVGPRALHGGGGRRGAGAQLEMAAGRPRRAGARRSGAADRRPSRWSATSTRGGGWRRSCPS